jgi:hypothetical protein
MASLSTKETQVVKPTGGSSIFSGLILVKNRLSESLKKPFLSYKTIPIFAAILMLN